MTDPDHDAPAWTREDDHARIDRLRPLADHLRSGHTADERKYRDTWLHIALLASEWYADHDTAAMLTKAERERLAATVLFCCNHEGRTGRDWCCSACSRLREKVLAAQPPAVLDATHIEHQRAWSARTFGPPEDRGPAGPLAHLRKELDEVAAEPHDLEEWVDVLILSIDGAWRAGHEPQAIIDAVKAKQAKNEARTWPEWRGVPSDQPIEHIR